MVYRNYRKKQSYRNKRSLAGGLLSDTSAIANRLSWQGAVLLGIVLVAAFYWVLPSWLTQHLDTLRGNMFYPAIEAAFGRRIHWLQWLGIALGLLCTYFAIRNFFPCNVRTGEDNTGQLGAVDSWRGCSTNSGRDRKDGYMRRCETELLKRHRPFMLAWTNPSLQ